MTPEESNYLANHVRELISRSDAVEELHNLIYHYRGEGMWDQRQFIVGVIVEAVRQQAARECAERLLNVARGCHDYGGGYRHDDRESEIYQHGIQTVINALEAAAKNDPSDTQVNALEMIGAATCKPDLQVSAPAGECSGPLPGGSDITVVQTGEKTVFVQPAGEHRHTDECLRYAAQTGKPYCIAECRDSAPAGEHTDTERLVSLRVGRKLFEFTSEQDWINHARDRFEQSGHKCDTTICIDSLGRECVMGGCFMRATKDAAYPISVYVSTSSQAMQRDAALDAEKEHPNG